MMKPFSIALALSLAGQAALAAEDTIATVHAVQGGSAALAHGDIIGASPGANSIAASFGGTNNAINILQNSGQNVVQNAQNVMARTVACECGAPIHAETMASQVSRVSMHDARIAGATGSNTLTGTFTGSGGMVNILQNTGNNVVQSAQNAMALIVRQP
jgi:hypothetical protein